MIKKIVYAVSGAIASIVVVLLWFKRKKEKNLTDQAIELAKRNTKDLVKAKNKVAEAEAIEIVKGATDKANDDNKLELVDTLHGS